MTVGVEELTLLCRTSFEDTVSAAKGCTTSHFSCKIVSSPWNVCIPNAFRLAVHREIEASLHMPVFLSPDESKLTTQFLAISTMQLISSLHAAGVETVYVSKFGVKWSVDAFFEFWWPFATRNPKRAIKLDAGHMFCGKRRRLTVLGLSTEEVAEEDDDTAAPHTVEICNQHFKLSDTLSGSFYPVYAMTTKWRKGGIEFCMVR
jgi:hypothetical protein